MGKSYVANVIGINIWILSKMEDVWSMKLAIKVMTHINESCFDSKKMRMIILHMNGNRFGQ